MHQSTAGHLTRSGPLRSFTQQEIVQLADLSENITFTAEIRAYQQNIITFLRLHRAVGSGVSPRATQQLIKLVKYSIWIVVDAPFTDLTRYLAIIHGQTYVSPSLVALGMRKIYPHRITILEPEAERSVQYGSDLKAVAAILMGCDPSQVIEEVLASVDIPV